MLAVRCGGGGAGAYLTARRIRAAQNGDGRGAILAAGAGAGELTLRVSFSLRSQHHLLGASCTWPVRCSSDASSKMEEWSVADKRRNVAWEVLKTEITDMFCPLLRNLAEISSLRSAYDLEDYQIGMLFGAFLGCVGCYQLWKTAPSIFIDVTLAFVFYKLSVVSSELHRRRESNSLITRLKFGTILIMVMKDIKKNYVLLDVIRMPVLLLYICAFIFDVAGMKKYARSFLISLVNLLKARGGIQEICRIMWYPGYISPYDDYADW